MSLKVEWFYNTSENPNKPNATTAIYLDQYRVRINWLPHKATKPYSWYRYLMVMDNKYTDPLTGDVQYVQGGQWALDDLNPLGKVLLAVLDNIIRHKSPEEAPGYDEAMEAKK